MSSLEEVVLTVNLLSINRNHAVSDDQKELKEAPSSKRRRLQRYEGKWKLRLSVIPAESASKSIISQDERLADIESPESNRGTGLRIVLSDPFRFSRYQLLSGPSDPQAFLHSGDPSMRISLDLIPLSRRDMAGLADIIMPDHTAEILDGGFFTASHVFGSQSKASVLDLAPKLMYDSPSKHIDTDHLVVMRARQSDFVVGTAVSEACIFNVSLNMMKTRSFTDGKRRCPFCMDRSMPQFSDHRSLHMHLRVEHCLARVRRSLKNSNDNHLWRFFIDISDEKRYKRVVRMLEDMWVRLPLPSENDTTVPKVSFDPDKATPPATTNVDEPGLSKITSKQSPANSTQNTARSSQESRPYGINLREVITRAGVPRGLAPSGEKILQEAEGSPHNFRDSSPGNVGRIAISAKCRHFYHKQEILRSLRSTRQGFVKCPGSQCNVLIREADLIFPQYISDLRTRDCAMPETMTTLTASRSDPTGLITPRSRSKSPVGKSAAESTPPNSPRPGLTPKTPPEEKITSTNHKASPSYNSGRSRSTLVTKPLSEPRTLYLRQRSNKISYKEKPPIASRVLEAHTKIQSRKSISASPISATRTSKLVSSPNVGNADTPSIKRQGGIGTSVKNKESTRSKHLKVPLTSAEQLSHRPKYTVPQPSPGVTYFRTRSKRPLKPGEELYESDDDIDETADFEKHRATIEGLADTSESEKRFMIEFDHFFRPRRILADRFWADELRQFILSKTSLLANKDMRIELIQKMAQMHSSGVIDKDELKGCTQEVLRAVSQRAGATLESKNAATGSQDNTKQSMVRKGDCKLCGRNMSKLNDSVICSDQAR